MLHDISDVDFYWVAAVSTLVGGAIAVLSKSKLRLVLLLLWTLIPAILAVAGVLIGLLEDPKHWVEIIRFGAVIGVVALQPSAMFSAIGFVIVRALRNPRAGELD